MQRIPSIFPVFWEFLFFLRNYADMFNTFDSMASMVFVKDRCWGRQTFPNFLMLWSDFQFPNKIWLLSFQNVIAWYLLILKIALQRTQIVVFKKLLAIYWPSFPGRNSVLFIWWKLKGSMSWQTRILLNDVISFATSRYLGMTIFIWWLVWVPLNCYLGNSEWTLTLRWSLQKVDTKKGGNCLLTKAFSNLLKHLRLFQRKKKYLATFFVSLSAQKSLAEVDTRHLV